MHTKNETTTPISVILPVYNESIDFLCKAIESVLNQTFQDFELIIIDDGSDSNSIEVAVKKYNDSRVKYIKKEHDFIDTLNLGLSISTGQYIARMDSDDLMHPDRLKIQYELMERENTVTVCGSWMEAFGVGVTPGTIVGGIAGFVKRPLLSLLDRNIIFHPTAMVRSSFIREYDIKYQNYQYAEDYKFWVDIAQMGGEFYIESQVLLYHRISSSQVSKKNSKCQRETSIAIKEEILSFLVNNCRPQLRGLTILHKQIKQIRCNLNLKLRKDIISFFYQQLHKRIGIVTFPQDQSLHFHQKSSKQ